MVSPLDHKLLRDLVRIKGQALAIGSVIALGVLTLVMMQGLVSTLDQTRQAYYERYRLADVFAQVQRAPLQRVTQLAAIAGVNAIQTRINGEALIDLPQVAVPLRARALSLPDAGQPRLNAVYLSEGRTPRAQHGDEIMLLKGFADARGLGLGDGLVATMNGTQRRFTIVGLAESPEFLYTTPPGELAPDASRFAVIWMSNTALSAAYDMDGAFNEVLLSLTPDAQLAAVLRALDPLLEAYGGRGATGQAEQLSDRFIREEIAGLRASAFGVPPVFMAVAAFLLYIVVSRIVQSERQQIGLLKAFGYRNREIGGHYLKLVLLIATAGALAGSLMGVAAGHSLASVYQGYFRFPFIVFRVEPGAFLTGIFVSVLSASAGGLVVLRGVVALTPAVAMRPPVPADYSRTSNWAQRRLDQPSRMVLRRLARQPGRMAGAVIGIATGMALSLAMISVLDGFDRTLDLTFGVLDRSDATVAFASPLSDRAAFNLHQLDGVRWVEPVRAVWVELRHGRLRHQTSINGLVAQPRLSRALDQQLQPIHIGNHGLVLSKPVAAILQAQVGDRIAVDVREGRRAQLDLPVIAISETLLGAPTYMDLDALNRALNEPNRISGATLSLDSNKDRAVYDAIKGMPAVSGITLKRDSIAAFQTLMDTGAGAMRYIMMLIAGVITFGIVYNTARIAFAERERDLASLRVIGFSRGETAFVLLAELAIVTLVALPVGVVIGAYLCSAIAAGFSTDLYQVQASLNLPSIGTAVISVVAAAVASGWLVKRDLDQIDLVSSLKSRE